MYITYGGYPIYIREGGIRCTSGRGYPMHIFSKPGLESEYPSLSVPVPSVPTPECWGTLQAADLGNCGLGKGHFGPF